MRQVVEVRLHVPEHRLAALRRATATKTAFTQRIQTRYFDAQDFRLAAAGLELSLSGESGAWLQTLRSCTRSWPNVLVHQVSVDPAAADLEVHLSLHDGTPFGRELSVFLRDPPSTLNRTAEMDIFRTCRVVRAAGGTKVQLCLDEGELRSGVANRPIRELILTSMGGDPSEVARLAARWVARFGLWIEQRNRGELAALSAGATLEATKSVSPSMHRKMGGDEALRKMVASSLQQILANASALASTESAAHLHQCRVGIRRLRSALRDFAVLDANGDLTLFDTWSADLATLFRQLGASRDKDVLPETLGAAQESADAPRLDRDLKALAIKPAATVLQDAHSNTLWLSILEWIFSAVPPEQPGATPHLRRQARQRLQKLQRRIAVDAGRFAALSEAEQHRVRKRIKRLRYGLEFFASLLPGGQLRRNLAILAAAQDALGRYTDMVVARDLLRAQLATQPEAWYFLGWLAAHRERALQTCAHSLARVAALPKP